MSATSRMCFLQADKRWACERFQAFTNSHLICLQPLLCFFLSFFPLSHLPHYSVMKNASHFSGPSTDPPPHRSCSLVTAVHRCLIIGGQSVTDANEMARSGAAIALLEQTSDDLQKAKLWQTVAIFRLTYTQNRHSLWRLEGYWLYIVLSCLCECTPKVKVLTAAQDK